jgi:hypothetical protein
MNNIDSANHAVSELLDPYRDVAEALMMFNNKTLPLICYRCYQASVPTPKGRTACSYGACCCLYYDAHLSLLDSSWDRIVLGLEYIEEDKITRSHGPCRYHTPQGCNLVIKPADCLLFLCSTASFLYERTGILTDVRTLLGSFGDIHDGLDVVISIPNPDPRQIAALNERLLELRDQIISLQSKWNPMLEIRESVLLGLEER